METREPRQPKEFEERVIEVNRVSKKTKGGNRISFSVLVVVGDRKGRVGVGLGKSPDVLSGIQKGIRFGRSKLIKVPIYQGTIPHEIYLKQGAARVLLKPAPKGTGVIAGGSIRAVVEAAGIQNIVTKQLGTRNKISNVYAAIEALKRLKDREKKSKPEKKTSKSKNK